MALETVKSTQITNRDAGTLNSPVYEANSLREKADVATVAASADVSSLYRMVDVPSNARVSDVIFAAGAMTTGKFDIGVWRNTRDGGAVVDADLFASAVNCSAAVAQTNVIDESGELTLAESVQPLWQAAGMSSDPMSTLDICLRATSAVTASASVFLKVRYVV